MEFEAIKRKMEALQDSITEDINQTLKTGYREDRWNYEKGEGGGITRIYQGGVLQKGGVNFSGVAGKLGDVIATKMNLAQGAQFNATGVSIVLHAENPYVPTVHMNVRYFEAAGKWWFGGGIDLTPNYPFEEDIIFFHKSLKNVCDGFEADAYAKYKKCCDEYFHVKHRNEMRGVGGIFFDYLSGDMDKISAFVFDLGSRFTASYLPIVQKRMDIPFGERQRKFQQIRRGRYVEFNLIYDRGTLFGLETGGRVESILMSLPETAGWDYAWQAPTPEEERIAPYLQPKNWL